MINGDLVLLKDVTCLQVHSWVLPVGGDVAGREHVILNAKICVRKQLTPLFFSTGLKKEKRMHNA